MSALAEVEYEVGTIVVTFDYDRELIEELKSSIPPGERHWDHERRAWVFTPAWWAEARRIIGMYCEIAD